MKFSLQGVLAGALTVSILGLNAQLTEQKPYKIKLAEEYKDSHFAQIYNSYQYVGTFEGEHYYAGELISNNLYDPYAIRQIYLKQPADLSEN